MEEQIQKILCLLNGLCEKEERLTLNPKECAVILGIGLNTMYELINTDKFPALRVGKKHLIVKANLPEWLKNNIGCVI